MISNYDTYLFVLVFAAGMTAVFVYNVFTYNWDLPTCFLFGSLICATDPVAVVALLSELGK